MLFKPNDIPIPRHTLQDDFDEGNIPEPLPQVTVNISDKLKPQAVVIVPEVLAAVVDQFPVKSAIGTVTISYTHSTSTGQEDDVDEEDFDEEEQLYSAIKYQHKYAPAELSILQLGDDTIAVVVPHFQHVIVYNVLAKVLVETLEPKTWVTLAPCPLENVVTASKITLNVDSDALLSKKIALIPDLRPPHCFTGISASINSRVSDLKCRPALVSIVLNAEGQPGYEKIGQNAQLEAAKIVGGVVYGDEKQEAEYLKNLATRLRRLNAHGDYGMYL